MQFVPSAAVVLGGLIFHAGVRVQPAHASANTVKAEI